MKNKLIVLLLSLFTISHTYSEVFPLCVTQNDDNPELLQLLVETNERGELQELIQRRFANESEFHAEIPSRERRFTKAELDQGVVLYERQGFEVIRLQNENLTTHSGGTARMYYKTNVLFQRGWSRSRSKLLRLVKANGSWYAADINNDRFNYAYARAGTTGLKDLSFSYNPEFDY